MSGTRVRRPLAICLAVGILCLLRGSLPAATVEWHLIGIPPQEAPPSAFTIFPASPDIFSAISFVAPLDGTVYINAGEAISVGGDPVISVSTNGNLITVTLTPPTHGPYPLIVDPVSGIDGTLGSLPAGTWGFAIFNPQGMLVSFNEFVVNEPGANANAPVLGIACRGNQVVLSWPSQATNSILQTTSDLSSGNWVTLTNGMATNGSNCVLTNTLAAPCAWFRLQAQ